MLDINKYISFSDEFNINFKNCLIDYLKEYNKILNESKLNNLINFINNGIIELSCDGPIREPYIAYLQGSLTYEYGKIGLIKAIENLENE